MVAVAAKGWVVMHVVGGEWWWCGCGGGVMVV